MAENSLRWAQVEDQGQKEWMKGVGEGYLGRSEKGRMLKAWRSEFEKWCQWVCEEFGMEVESSDEEEDEEEEEEEDSDE